VAITNTAYIKGTEKWSKRRNNGNVIKSNKVQKRRKEKQKGSCASHGR